MNNLIINFEVNNDYIMKMLDYITRFLDELDKMDLYPNELSWKSHNKDLIVELYKKELNNYHIFANNLYKLLKKIDEYTEEYQECTNDIKLKLKSLEEKYRLGDRYE